MDRRRQPPGSVLDRRLQAILGTGLGLAISRRLVELIGGTMWVESEKGKGSTFHIGLVAEEAEVPARFSEYEGLPQLAGKRILVVDDNATNREIVIRQTRAWEMEPVLKLFNALITVLADRAKEPEAPPVAADGVKPATSALRMLRELGGDDFLGELIDTFLAEAPSLLATLRRALEQDEADEAQRAAHTPKSNGATFGADDFSELCRELEARAKDGRLEGAEQLVDRIDEEYARPQEALAALRALP